MSDLLNFGFDPTGTALGSEGSPSMPGAALTGMEHPMDANLEAFDEFVMQTQRRYGDVSDPGGTVYDPRGDRALSSKPSDYRDTDMMRPDEISLRLNSSDDQLLGGDPVLAPYNPGSAGMAQALYDMDVGFSPEGAATLADSLSTYDPRILEGIKIPRAVEPRVTNALGFAGQHGGLPEAFFDPGTGMMKQGMPEAVDRVISQSAQFQYVDQSGVVDKYTPGNGPYDTIAQGRMAGLRMGQPGTPNPGGSTPAQVRKYGGALGQSAKNAGGSTKVSGAVYRWKFLTDGEFSRVEGDMKNWTPSNQAPANLPATAKPTELFARGRKTGRFYALADSYAFSLFKRSGSSWVPVVVPSDGQESLANSGGSLVKSYGPNASTGGGGVANGGVPYNPLGDYSVPSGMGSGGGGGGGGGAGSGGGLASGAGEMSTDVVSDEGDEGAFEEEKPCSKWWWLLLLIPVAGGGIYYASRKKKGKR